MDLESMAAGGGVVGGLGVIITGLVKLVGSRKERSADTQAAADAWRLLHHECKAETDALRAHLDAQDRRLQALERVSREHERCAPRIAQLEREQVIASGMIADLMRNASTTTTPEDVRAALAQEDTDR